MHASININTSSLGYRPVQYVQQPQYIQQTQYIQQPLYVQQPQFVQQVQQFINPYPTQQTTVRNTNVFVQQGPQAPPTTFINNRSSLAMSSPRSGRIELDSMLHRITEVCDTLYSSILTNKEQYISGSAAMKNLKKNLAAVNMDIDKVITDLNITQRKAMTESDFQGSVLKAFGSVNKLMQLLWTTKRMFKSHLGSGTAKKICLDIELKSSRVNSDLKMNINIDSAAQLGGSTGLSITMDDRESFTKCSQLDGEKYVTNYDFQ